MSLKAFRSRRAGIAGATALELIVASAIIGILFLPIVRFIGTALRGVLSMQIKHQGLDLSRYAMVDIERDFKDMNEVVVGSRTLVMFYIDSHRLPTYLPDVDSDGDTILNRQDPDDDNDGLSGQRTAQDYLNLTLAIATTGWRHGYDLQDDDDDNDGNRDVLCRYRYLKAKGQLVRDFRYNGGSWTDGKIVLEKLTAFEFNYNWSPQVPNPISGELNLLMDLPQAVPDGIFDMRDLDGEIDVGGNCLNGGNCNGALDLFTETRPVIQISYKWTIKPNPNRSESFSSQSSIKPPLMAVKEKYR